jgi:hypothetical protein
MRQPLLITPGLRHDTRRKEPGTFRIVEWVTRRCSVGATRGRQKDVPTAPERAIPSARRPVVNFAVPGYNTAMESETFVQKCLRCAARSFF